MRSRPTRKPREGELGKSGYRISNAYQFAGSRTQIECTLPNGRTYSNIEVVSGKYAWDEDRPGAGLVPGEGTAKPMRDKVDERLIRLWASPQGAPKAALAGAGIDPMKVFRNPGGLLEEGTSKIGDTSVTWDGDTPGRYVPDSGRRRRNGGCQARRSLHDRIRRRHAGRNTLRVRLQRLRRPQQSAESDRSLHARQNDRSASNGQVVRDVNTVVTETGSVYVVVPVPPNVGPTQPLPMYGSDQQAPVLTSNAADAALGQRQARPHR